MSEEDTELLGGSAFGLTQFFRHPFRLFDMLMASKLLVTDGKGGYLLRDTSCQILSGSVEESTELHYLNCMIHCLGRKHGEKILQEDCNFIMRTLHSYSYCLSILSTKCLAAAIVMCLLIVLVPSSFGVSKRVVVLYFEDHSRFDHPTGCGCIPTGPFSGLFGGRKHHKRWHLKEGFTELLNRKLEKSEIYEPVSQDELLDAMAETGLSRRALSDSKNRAQLAKALKVDALIVGDIRKFNQERVKANAGRLIRQGAQGFQNATANYVGGVQVRGSLYIASIQLEMQLFGTSGDEIGNPKIASRKQHQLGGLTMGPP